MAVPLPGSPPPSLTVRPAACSTKLAAPRRHAYLLPFARGCLAQLPPACPSLPPSDGSSAAMVYLTSTFLDTSRPVPAPINYVEALDASTGALKWANFTNPPPNSGLTASDTASSWGVTPLPGLAVYAQGSKLYGLAAQDGKQLWAMTVATGIGSGLSPNISSIVYVEPAPPARAYPTLLLTSTTFEQTRFLAYKFNGSAGQPPAVMWQVRARG